jgi:hypothetical protein
VGRKFVFDVLSVSDQHVCDAIVVLGQEMFLVVAGMAAESGRRHLGGEEGN